MSRNHAHLYLLAAVLGSSALVGTHLSGQRQDLASRDQGGAVYAPLDEHCPEQAPPPRPSNPWLKQLHGKWSLIRSLDAPGVEWESFTIEYHADSSVVIEAKLKGKKGMSIDLPAQRGTYEVANDKLTLSIAKDITGHPDTRVLRIDFVTETRHQTSARIGGETQTHTYMKVK